MPEKASLKFKTKEAADQYEMICPMLRLICEYVEQISLCYNLEPTITRIIGKIVRDSGVHAVGRAVDFRTEIDGRQLYTDEQIKTIVQKVNERFPRSDEHLTAKYHSHEDNPMHLHVQVPPDIKILHKMLYNIYLDDLPPAA